MRNSILLSLLTIILFCASMRAAEAAPAEKMVADLFQEIDQERHKYELYGFYPGMTIGEIRALAAKGTGLYDRYPTMRFNVDGRTVHATYPAIVDKANLDKHELSEVRFNKVFAEGTMDVDALEKGFIEKLGQPTELTKKEDSLLLTYQNKRPQPHMVMRQCVNEYKAKHGAAAAQKEKHKINRWGKSTGVGMVAEFEKFMHYCPNTVPVYRDFAKAGLSAFLRIQIQPSLNKMDIIMTYGAGSIIREHNLKTGN